jgi:CheY-like chemotaxis protein
MIGDISSGSTQPHDVAAILPNPAKTFRVFHINDSTDDQVLFQAACQKGGIPFNWHVADSAQKGISYLKTLVEHSEEMPVCWPDLVLLDLVMPIVNGFEVLRFIRATPELKHLPVVVFTGDTVPANRADSLKMGANAFMLKPQSFSEAVALARELYNLFLGLKR